jgi:hypothetical protein
MKGQKHYPRYKYRDAIDLLWDTFGTASFLAADIREQAPQAYQSQLLRGLVNRGVLDTTPDAKLRKNGQTRPRYSFTPEGIFDLKRRRNEPVPVCARLSDEGRCSSVRKFFRDRCVHCGGDLDPAAFRVVGVMVLPFCPDCAALSDAGDPANWNACLASLIRTKHGGQWRLEGMDLLTRCGKLCIGINIINHLR